MEAVHLRRQTLLVGLLSGLVLAQWVSVACSQPPGQPRRGGFNVRTQNFMVYAPTRQLADSVASEAERFRDELAEYWLGKKLPPWRTPCPINVVAGPNLAAQGATHYDGNTGRNFTMEVIGTPERILDSVLPHEVSHTVLATHFRGPLPRWADEGICTTVEHDAERNKHEVKLREFLKTRRGIAMNRLFLLTEYPNDMLPMYAQGYSVCRFLIAQSGPRQFIEFLEDYMRQTSSRNTAWTDNVRKYYGYNSLAELQKNWVDWVASGSGPVDAFVASRTRAVASIAANARQPVATGAGIRLASADGSNPPNPDATAASGSWYGRRRQQTAAGQIASAGLPQTSLEKKPSGKTAASRIAPPSVLNSGHYSVSQPAAEQRFGQPANQRRIIR